MSHWQNKSYFATLAIRASEMNGLEYLPGSTKDALVPVVLLAPWGASRTLEQAIERFERAYPGRRYVLDIDRDYYPTNASHPAQARWLSLRDPSRRFRNWTLFWRAFPEAVPCLQTEGQSAADLHTQIDDIQGADREFCYRIELFRQTHDINTVISVLVDRGTADFSVILEAGWISDALTLSPTYSGLINGALARLDGRVPIIASCTTIRKDFTRVEGVVTDPFSNRLLLEQIRRGTNRALVVYGDWGSTKPRDDSFGRTPLPRIDYPCDEKWLLSRSRSKNWDYSAAAAQIVSTPDWNGNLGVWGEELIFATAKNDEFAIDTPAKNVAARVNIHLHRQAHFGQNLSNVVLDEAWVD